MALSWPPPTLCVKTQQGDSPLRLQEALDTYLPLIEEELHVCMTAPADSPPAFFGMMQYHLGWTDDQFRPVQMNAGKRLRPVFTLLACQASGGSPPDALPAAAAVELIHNFSLIHDDIQDRSDTRRGRATVWALWGEAQAINAGDTMFTLAHLALHRLTERGLPAERVIAACRSLDEANLALCRGQHLDLDFETRLAVNVDAYLTMIQGKTAALLGCSGQLGALVASPDRALAERYHHIGEELGLAFQIQDDLLGIWGQAEVTGKPIADDIRRRKKSLPVLYVLGRQNDPDAKRLRALYAQDTLSEEDVYEAVSILNASQARPYAERLAHQHLETALCELEAAGPEPEADEALRELAHFLIRRTY
jgi:geranylgeranyl diphosphate synthase type I